MVSKRLRINCVCHEDKSCFVHKDVAKPINYNFGVNWETKIVPLLNQLSVQQAIESSVNGYLNNFNGNTEKYKKYTPYASYTSSDAYVMLMDRFDDIEIERLRKENKLSKKYLRYEKNIDDAGLWNYLDEREKILATFHSWEFKRTRIETYVLYHSCHWIVDFNIALAQLLEPKEEWYIREGNMHSTVVNTNSTKCFDILYWAHAYLHNYLFGDELKNHDVTFGGHRAYMDSKS